MGKILKKTLKILGVLFVTIFICFAIFLFGLSYGNIDFEASKFNSEEWKQSEPVMSWESPRLKMVDDLIENHLIKNMHVTEVIKLIGEPDDTPYFRNYDMVYYLGRERSVIGIDSEWLVFKVENYKVKLFRLVRD